MKNFDIKLEKTLDLSRWKEFSNFVKGMWIGNYRLNFLENCGNRKFHGNFIPEIPYIMMLRYTNIGDSILDPMAGSGTTGDVGKLIDRNVDMFDLNPINDDIQYADSLFKDFGNEKYDLIIWHPPYSNIIKFSDHLSDLSNYKYSEFLEKFKLASSNITKSLKAGKYLILVCGEIYANGEEIPLGFLCSQILKSNGFIIKGIIVKDYGETQGGNIYNSKNKNLQIYRHLKYGTWEFSGDYIFVLKKEKTK